MLFHSPNVLRERLTMGVSPHGFLRMAPHLAARERLHEGPARTGPLDGGSIAAFPAPSFRRSLGAVGRGKRI
jgi:hypothetical protein